MCPHFHFFQNAILDNHTFQIFSSVYANLYTLEKIWTGMCKTIKVATRSARLSRHVTQECTANFQWRRKSSQNVNKDFLVVRFGNITKDFISWRRCAKMKIRYYESIRPKKSEKISLFDFQNKKNVQVRTYSRKYLDPVKLFGVQNTLFHLCTSTVI